LFFQAESRGGACPKFKARILFRYFSNILLKAGLKAGLGAGLGAGVKSWANCRSRTIS